jgi:cytolysin-activating lysine-acyltransferase
MSGKNIVDKKNIKDVNLASGRSDLENTVENIKEQVKETAVDLPELPARTISSMIGDIVWLMSQSQGHKYLTLADLEWMLMPPLVLEQYKIYRDDKQRPAGVALWAYLNEEAETKLQYSGKIAPTDWGNGAELSAEKGLEKREGGNLWLIELIAPFSNEANKQKEKMLGDLMNTRLKDTPFKMMRANPETGKREAGWVNEK